MTWWTQNRGRVDNSDNNDNHDTTIRRQQARRSRGEVLRQFATIAEMSGGCVFVGSDTQHAAEEEVGDKVQYHFTVLWLKFESSMFWSFV